MSFKSPITKICLNSKFKTPQKASSDDEENTSATLLSDLKKIELMLTDGQNKKATIHKHLSQATTKHMAFSIINSASSKVTDGTDSRPIKASDKSAIEKEYCAALTVQIDLDKPHSIFLAAIELDSCRRNGAIWSPCTFISCMAEDEFSAIEPKPEVSVQVDILKEAERLSYEELQAQVAL